MERGSWRSWRRTRAAVAVVRAVLIGCPLGVGGGMGGGGVGFVHEAQEALLDGVGVRTGAQCVRGVLREDAALAHEEQVVAALGFVHDVGGDEEGGAAGGGEVVEEVPQVAAQDGVEADRRFVEDQELRAAEEGDGEGDAAALAAGEVPGEGGGVGGEVHVGDGAGDGLPAAVGGGAAGVEDRGEVLEVLPDAEVVVDGGRLGDVADAERSSGWPAGVAEDLEGAGDVGLGAYD